jgi:hypothetical protein
MSDDATGGMGGVHASLAGIHKKMVASWQMSRPIEPIFRKVKHFPHNVNATIDSSIEVCQEMRPLIVSEMDSMLSNARFLRGVHPE